MENNELSIMDAFKALSDIDEDFVMPVRTKKHSSKLKEGKGFDINDPHAIEAAKKFNEAEEPEEVELEVIDADADSVDHLKNKAEYVGQMLLQCKSCKATRFMDNDKLVASENDEDVYNLEDECPHCHNVGNGYTLLGQVGKVAEPEEDAKIENDMDKEEATLDNDGAEQAQPAPEAEPAAPEGDAVAPEAAPVSLDDSDGSYDQTNAADDTADMESGKLGDEINDNEFPWDDTEEKPADEPKEDPLADLLQPDEKKDEELEEEVEPVEEDLLISEAEDELPMELEPEMPVEGETEVPEETPEEAEAPVEEVPEEEEPGMTVGDFCNKFIVDSDNEDVEYKVTVVKGDESETYDLEELPRDVLDQEFEGLSSNDKELNIYVQDEESEILLGQLLVGVDDRDGELKIRVSDDEDIDETLSVNDAAEKYGDKFVARIDRPMELIINLGQDEEEAPEAEDDSLVDVASEPEEEEPAEESLEESIFRLNKMVPSKVNKVGTDEYWIRESIESREDLAYVFKNFVLPTENEALIRRFKFETMYRDLVDQALLEAYNKEDDYSDWKDYVMPITEEVSEQNTAYNRALATAKKAGKPVIYGYQKSGKFYSVDEIVCDDLRKETDDFMKRYHPSASVAVAYPDKEYVEEEMSGAETLAHNIESDDYVDPATGEQDPEMEQEIEKADVDESVRSFKTRNALALAIKECKNNNQPYSVRRSLKEGYRYDLVINEESVANKLDQVTDKLDTVKQEINQAISAVSEEVAEESKPEVCPDCGKEVCECNKEHVEECNEGLEFDDVIFDAQVNNYFDANYDECIRYMTESGTINEHGKIVLEGVVTYGDDAEEKAISFTLTPDTRLVEGVSKTVYTVTNTLSDEVFECEME